MSEIVESNNTNTAKEARILYLVITEREKSLQFYESLLNPSENVDKNLREIFSKIAQKEREILAHTRAILDSLDTGKSSDFNASDLTKTNEILLPSALPQNILGELQNEMGEVDSKSLNILAMGVESHHLKSCDFLIKQAQNLCANAKIIDTLYQLQALSYNHHIALLQGESPKENASPNPANLANNANLPQALQDLLNQNPLFSEIKTALDSFQHFYAETKGIVAKLEKGELSQNELVAFLQRLRF